MAIVRSELGTGLIALSPDGRTIAFSDLLTEVFNSIDGACPRVWSPDEQWLAFNCINAVDTALNDGIWLADLETGKLLKANLPDNAQIRGWVNLQP